MPPRPTNDYESHMLSLMQQAVGLLASIDQKLEAKASHSSRAPRYDKTQYEALAIELFKKNGGLGSVSALQREFSIGYVKAASIIDSLEKQELISAPIPDKMNMRQLIN